MTRTNLFTLLALVAATALAGGAILLHDGRAPGAAAEAHDHGGKAGAHDDDGDDHDHGDDHGANHAAAPDAIAMPDAVIAASRITVASAGPATLDLGADFHGEVRFNADRTAQVVPRVAGVVESVAADLGQRVRRGEVLAVIGSATLSEQRAALLSARERRETAAATFERERRLWEAKVSAEQDYLLARQALREAEIEQRNAETRLRALGADLAADPSALGRLAIRAPFDGIVVEKRLALGESVAADASVFMISDLSTVWIDLVVSAQDIGKVPVGARASVTAAGGGAPVEGRVSYVGNLFGESTRSATARIVLPNPQGLWRPGLFVNARVVAGQAKVAVAVPADALHTVEDRPSVFVRTAVGFEARPVTTGRADGAQVEIVAGLAPGETYAAGNGFLLKADLAKGSAEHSH
ncbi:efflux RND transporter periplasmic adaptor subunit [Derxia gummosa]|uniref:Efflux RND transporter periplasmic adaptor subunit n=1 Tax=Derxia gummosa DSM 723 TaxID=1121388 RepID=A0A8B6X4I0_9BURK|nr:efflux RND transporter periplasmic adaptor subunit [Derxia gummosa]